MERYPNDCSAACSNRATWEFHYTQKGTPGYNAIMRACDDHKTDILKAANVSAVKGTVAMAPKGQLSTI